MNILLSNDDGIYAPGIEALYTAASTFGNVTVVAPDGERSAAGHGITISDPIKVKEIETTLFKGYATSGTPADCIKIACGGLLNEMPDLIISGINLGANTGISVAYSGTVSAAAEGAVQGVPSIAFSLATFTNPQWETATKMAKEFLVRYLKSDREWPSDTLLNVNIPNIAEPRGFKAVHTAKSRFEQLFHKRHDPRGNIYFWLDGDMINLETRPNNDLQAVEDGYVAVAPVAFAATRSDQLPDLVNLCRKPI